MSEETWKKEMGVRAKKDPLDLQSLPAEEMSKELRARLANRERVKKSRCRQEETRTCSTRTEKDIEKAKRVKDYQRNYMRHRRNQGKKGESSTQGQINKDSEEELGEPEASVGQQDVPGDTSVLSNQPTVPGEPSLSDAIRPPTPNLVTPATLPDFTLNPSSNNDTINTVNTEPGTRDQRIQDFTQIPGCEFPSRSKDVLWPGHKIRTKLPWISDPQDSDKNILQNDENHVRYLAESAIPATQSDWVVFLNYQDYTDDFELAEVIKEDLGHGNVVVLTGYPYDHVPLTVTSLWKNYKLPKERIMVVSDAEERVYSSTYPHVKMTLQNFCNGVSDSSRVQCILDCPTIDGDKPNIIKFLDDGHTAWYHLHDKFPHRQAIPLDIQKSSSWLLFHQALYHTYCHHDADGYATWTQIIDGLKFWVVMRPRGYENFKGRVQILESCKNYLSNSPTENGFYGDGSERFVIYGSPGDIIFQPPSTLHEVYTPTPSITRGGHFLTYESLHLTEFSRALDFHTDEGFSNQSHPSASLTIMMMMAALPYLDQYHLRTKSLSALCQMVIHPLEYAQKFVDTDVQYYNSLVSKKDRISSMPDVLFAINLAKYVVKLEGLDIEVCHSLEGKGISNDFLFSGPSWLEPGLEVDRTKTLRFYIDLLE